MMKKSNSNKKLAAGLIAIIILVGAGALKIGSFLPVIGAQDTPANSYLSEYYISHAVEDTAYHNIVTAVLADYRGFDTLFETCVLFLSGITAVMILSTKKKISHDKTIRTINDNSEHIFSSNIMDAAFRIVVPIILIYGIYVLIHGEISLGGGFQAGALLACAYLLDRIIPSFQMRVKHITDEIALITAGTGALFYVITGVLPMLNGGNFLEFSKLPFGSGAGDIAGLHSTGILMIEIGVTLCVMGIIITILEVVLERTDFDD